MHVSFEESQKIDSVWPLTILAITLVFNYVLYFHLGESNMDVFYGTVIAAVVLSALFSILKLHTKIDKNSIQYKFFPFHLSFKNIAWSQVESCEMRTFKPLSEYGGWGLRFGPSGRAYTITGNKGLQLYTKGNKKILIGTHNTVGLEAFLRGLNKIK
jgi:hypothetical protein